MKELNENLPALTVSVEEIRDALPALKLSEMYPKIGLGLAKYVELARRAEVVAARMPEALTTAEDAGRAAELLASIKTVLTQLEDDRKGHTSAFDAMKNGIMNLFNSPKSRLIAVHGKVDAAASKWRKQEGERLAAEARLARERQIEEAQKRAALQAKIGDAEGAEKIRRDAEENPPEVPKVRVVGVYGSRMTTRERTVGEVADRRAFLKALAQSTEPLMTEVLEGITFPQAKLNALAKGIEEGEVLPPAGLKVKKLDSTSIR